MANYAENRKARFNYEIVEKYETGIELLGVEVKSVRGGQMSLEGAFVIVRGGEVYLINANIPPYQAKNAPKDYDPLRNRRLLLTKKEITELAGNEKNKSLTIVPISVYNKGRKIKVEIALVKGKKKFDKRRALEKRETDRSIRREMKRGE
ncbi:SsrA-binding protein [Candidatus Nomurabacteria bacterium RIFCSPHIGHO2_01_FULL_42_15]|uniref:SsrA-binding protein n=1 Tax=Candidatus Nomurabacteria bacterium RIFCSPHIGHO2_01_FULL_42_15 TaxID=1801742 RepID=A0A1F6VF31_9BACT|nr:MAG: SsrA-binding protein [Candidatus Nomurabacteria bacterium RIFCSPHIGHO2_01_FULL_42_15]OGI93408.1 MAG: SsrA-binding protein [Candidatus Nomurabacteria bacterium RIFCSPLOWO2_01_FULL_41_18]